jgi:hypothetical protein
MNLISFAESEVDCELSNNLLQNDDAISFSKAIMISKKFILRWRFRVCRICKKDFDIEEKGFGYNCGCFE